MIFSKQCQAFAALLILVISPSSLSIEPQVQSQINRHLLQGNTALSLEKYDEAAENYKSCLDLDPDQESCLINYASTLVDMNGVPSYDQDPSIQQNRLVTAQRLLRHVLDLHPNNGDAAFNLGLLIQDSSKSEESTREAARLYLIAVKASLEEGEERWDAWANLASAEHELGRFLGFYGARRAYERSILLLEQIAEQYRSYTEELSSKESSVHFDEKELQNVHAEVRGLNAYLSKLYYGYGTVLTEIPPADCLGLMSEKDSLLMDTHDGIDEESAKRVCEMNAINAMRLAVNLDSNNIIASHMLAAMTEGEEGDESNKNGRQRASNEFVSALFDDFADTFDEKLGALGYRVPQFVGNVAHELLKQSNRKSFKSALDAGCGTGLAGRFLRPLVEGPIVGIDLSKKMLELAAQCTISKGCGLKEESNEETSERSDQKLYDHLASLDLETTTLDDLMSGNDFLDEVRHGFDLIVAADVLVYFGDIQKLLTNLSKLSSDTAFLIFSCERIEEENAPASGWKLQISGRYAHSKSYVVEAAKNAGYNLVGYELIVPRMEKGEEVKGHMFQFVLGEINSNDEL
mmetsp:Transcript_14382/g.29328  ORF Transcript_14382/g.29328 Transcript_14382/m.29328 type:complete len:576 (-) Transcript_14382:2478-4205(-)